MFGHVCSRFPAKASKQCLLFFVLCCRINGVILCKGKTFESNRKFVAGDRFFCLTAKYWKIFSLQQVKVRSHWSVRKQIKDIQWPLNSRMVYMQWRSEITEKRNRTIELLLRWQVPLLMRTFYQQREYFFIWKQMCMRQEILATCGN